MRSFISRKMSDVFRDFERELSTMDRFCELKGARYDWGNVPDYENIHIQQLYLLRYFPAYLVEYYLIYRKLISYDFLTHYKVISLGCGANLDFYGLFFALHDHGTAEQAASFSYKGLDKTKWRYQEDLGVSHYNFIHAHINQWNSLDATDYNVIILPKSIGEFSERTFRHLQTIFLKSNFTEKNIVLISSIMQQHNPTDMYRYETIASLLTTKLNFTNLDNNRTYFHVRDAGTGFGLSNCCEAFYYPDEVKSAVGKLQDRCPVYRKQQKSCEDDCSDALNTEPVLTASYIQFQINRFTRE